MYAAQCSSHTKVVFYFILPLAAGNGKSPAAPCPGAGSAPVCSGRWPQWISLGALTHSVEAFDISALVQPKGAVTSGTC